MRAIVVALLCLSSLVYAADDPHTVQARAFYESGTVNYNVGNYQKALELFQSGYLEKHDPVFIFNMAQCQKMLGRYDDAVISYMTYEREASLESDERAKVDHLIATVNEQKLTHTLPVEKPSPSQILPPKAVAPAAQPPPPQQIIVQLPPPQPVSLRAEPPSHSAAGWALLGTGLVVAGVGAGLLGYAPTVHNEATNATTVADLENDNANYHNLQIAGYCVLGAGVVLTLGSLTAFSVAAYHYNRGN